MSFVEVLAMHSTNYDDECEVLSRRLSTLYNLYGTLDEADVNRVARKYGWAFAYAHLCDMCGDEPTSLRFRSFMSRLVGE